MICTNMNKPSAKTIVFAAFMYFSERLVQELKKRLSKNLVKYNFNNWFAVVNNDKFLGFPKKFCSISFSLMNGCLIENASCSDIICSRIVIGRFPWDRTIHVTACNKILFFPPFLFFNYGKGETNEPLGSKKTKLFSVKRIEIFIFKFHLWEWH